MKKKPFLITIILLLCAAVLCFALTTRETFQGHTYYFTAPEGMEAQPTGSKFAYDLLSDGKVVGGILDASWSDSKPPQIHAANFVDHADYILAALRSAGFREADKNAFDQMMGSSTLADCEIWFGNPSAEYKHYLFFFDDGYLDFWFDMTQTDEAAAQSLLATVDVGRLL